MSSGWGLDSRAIYALAGFSAGALVFAIAVVLDPGLASQGLVAMVRPATVLAALSPVFLGAVGWFAGRTPIVVASPPTPSAAPARASHGDETIVHLRKQLAEARERSAAKSDFLASMSHELRTPLNAIIGYSEMLAEDLEEGLPAGIDDVNRVTVGARQLLQLINDILDLSKIEVGKMSVLLEPVSVRSLLEDVQRTSEPLAAAKDNVFEVELDPHLRRVRGDHMRLRQILINLLSNAFKFTEGGTVKLHARRHVDEKGNPWGRISVTDSGIGMSVEQVEMLFADYTQAASEIKRKYGGTGLGLAISQRFAQMMFGRIEVASAPGEGSTFTLWLPLANLDEPPSMDGEIGRPALWIVDPDPSARRLLQTLGKRGFDAEIRPISAVDGELPDLMVVDVDGQDGWSVLDDLADKDVKRVIIASVDDTALDRAGDLGATFMRKPIDAELLVARCALLMRG